MRIGTRAGARQSSFSQLANNCLDPISLFAALVVGPAKYQPALSDSGFVFGVVALARRRHRASPDQSVSPEVEQIRVDTVEHLLPFRDAGGIDRYKFPGLWRLAEFNIPLQIPKYLMKDAK